MTSRSEVPGSCPDVDRCLPVPVESDRRVNAERFIGRMAVVTGASQGIGRAIALALAGEGADLVLLGRHESTLQDVAADVAGFGNGRCATLPVDLESEQSLRRAADRLLDTAGPLDLVVHCGGQYTRGGMHERAVSDLDLQYTLTVRAPYLLTQLLLSKLRAQPSDVVFLGSPVRPSAELSAYACGHAAQRALVHALREEVSGQQIRVLNVFPGRTATPRQERIFQLEGRLNAYRPELLLQPSDIAQLVLDALGLPRRAEVTELWLRPSQPSY
jgi:NADP-dependent 3-hydroxy acid dehydrogenase YdfG